MPLPDNRRRRTGRHSEINLSRANSRVACDRRREMKDLADMMDAGPPENGVGRHNFATIDDAANTLGLTAERGRVAGRLIREVAEDARDLLSVTKAAREAGIPQPAIVEMIRRGMDLRHRLAKGGEGSRGGTVIGHTSSGKPVYASRAAHHSAHQNWSAKDHEEAADLHYAAGEKHGMSDRGRAHRRHSDSHHEAWSHAVAAERRGQAPTFHHRFDSDGVRKGGDSAPVGTVRQWKDGRKYRKTGPGKWVPVGQRGGARGADGAGGGSPPKMDKKARGRKRAPSPKSSHDPKELREGKTASDRFSHIQRMAGAAGKRIHGDFDEGKHSHDHMDALERQLKQHIVNGLQGSEPAEDETGTSGAPESQAPQPPEDPDAAASQEAHSGKLSAMHKLASGLKGKAVFDRAWHAVKTSAGAKTASSALKKLNDGVAPSSAEISALVSIGSAAGMAAMVASGYGEHAGGAVLSQQFLAHVAEAALHAHLNRTYASYAAHSFVKDLHTPMSPKVEPEQPMAKAEGAEEGGDDKALQDLVRGMIAQMQEILGHDWTPEEIESAEAGNGEGEEGEEAEGEEGGDEADGAEGEAPEGNGGGEEAEGDEGPRPSGHDAPEQLHEQHRQTQEAQDAIDKLNAIKSRLDSPHQKGMFKELSDQAKEITQDPSPQALEWLNKRIDSFVHLVSGVNPGEEAPKEEEPAKKAILLDPRSGRLIMKARRGEGSRGGQVIGHTSSGKPVYAKRNAGHTGYSGWSRKDHADAAELHDRHLVSAEERIGHRDPDLRTGAREAQGRHLDARDSHRAASAGGKRDVTVPGGMKFQVHGDSVTSHKTGKTYHRVDGKWLHQGKPAPGYMSAPLDHAHGQVHGGVTRLKAQQKAAFDKIQSGQSVSHEEMQAAWIHYNREGGKLSYKQWKQSTPTRLGKARGATDAEGTPIDTPADDPEEDLEVRPVGFRPALPIAKAGGPFIGPRGGKWADARHTIPWKEGSRPTPQVYESEKYIQQPDTPSASRMRQVATYQDGEVSGHIAASTMPRGGGPAMIVLALDVDSGHPLVKRTWLPNATEASARKWLESKLGPEDDEVEKAGPFIGPRGGKWADARHTIPWKEGGDKRGGPSEADHKKIAQVLHAHADQWSGHDRGRGIERQTSGPGERHSIDLIRDHRIGYGQGYEEGDYGDRAEVQRIERDHEERIDRALKRAGVRHHVKHISARHHEKGWMSIDVQTHATTQPAKKKPPPPPARPTTPKRKVPPPPPSTGAPRLAHTAERLSSGTYAAGPKTRAGAGMQESMSSFTAKDSTDMELRNHYRSNPVHHSSREKWAQDYPEVAERIMADYPPGQAVTFKERVRTPGEKKARTVTRHGVIVGHAGWGSVRVHRSDGRLQGFPEPKKLKVRKSEPIPALRKGARAPHPRNRFGHRDDLEPGMLLHPRERHAEHGVVEVMPDGAFKLGTTIHKGGHSLLSALHGSADHRTTVRRYFKLGGERKAIPRANVLTHLRGLLKSEGVVVQRAGQGYNLTGDLRKAGIPDYMLTTGDRSAHIDREAGFDLVRLLGASNESA